jgi:nitroreductase
MARSHVEADDLAAALAGVLGARHSCRAFLADPVPDGVIDRILAMAQTAASWCNSQAWQVSLTRGSGTERLSTALMDAAATREPVFDIPEPAAYRGVYQARRRSSGYALYNSLGIARDDRDGRRRQMLENFRFFGAPHHAVITTDASLGQYGLVDCGGYIATFLLAAQSFGVASIAQAAVAMYSAVLRDELSIPDDRVIVCGISFGYEDATHPANRFRTDREHPSNVVQRVDV